jgi:hypothetical protein
MPSKTRLNGLRHHRLVQCRHPILAVPDTKTPDSTRSVTSSSPPPPHCLPSPPQSLRHPLRPQGRMCPPYPGASGNHLNPLQLVQAHPVVPAAACTHLPVQTPYHLQPSGDAELVTIPPAPLASTANKPPPIPGTYSNLLLAGMA